MNFRALGRRYLAEVDGESVRLFFPPPAALRLSQEVEIDGRKLPVHFVHNGAPHVVVFLEELPAGEEASLGEFDLESFARPLRHHPAFAPEGVNVNVVRIDPDGHVDIRTFEKGVEAETAANLLRAADEALYRAKKQQRGSYLTARGFTGELRTE